MRPFSLAVVVALALPSAMSAQSWRVDAKPVLDISSNGPDGSILFTHATGSTRLGNGTIVVADRDDNVLHFFDAKGKPLHAAGHPGSGPGEFRTISWFGRCAGDSLLVWDMLQLRMSVFAPSGAFARQFVPAEGRKGGQPVLTVACSSTGSLVFQGQPARVPGAPPRKPTSDARADRIMRVAAPILMADASGKVTRDLGMQPAGPWYLIGHGGFPLPLAATTCVAIAGGRTFVGMPDSSSRVTAYDVSGAATIIQLHVAARPVTAAEREHAVTALAAMAPPSLRDSVQDSLQLSPMPKMLPPYSALFGDRDGVLWVQLTVAGEADTRLRAIGPRNQVLGDVTLPANVVVQEIGRDYILGSVSDADDAPHVVMYRLHRGGK